MEDPTLVELRKSKAFIKGGGSGGERKVPYYYQYITSQVAIDGLWLDFCIGTTNATTQHIINYSPKDVNIYGFDWFMGLPEDWVAGKREIHKKGKFRAAENEEGVDTFIEIIQKRNPRLKVVKGLIQDTLPGFLDEHKETCAFVHFDCDLYDPTAFALSLLQERIVSGTVIAFDEFCGYENYLDHEYKAFIEFIESTGYEYEFIAHVRDKRQAALRIL